MALCLLDEKIRSRLRSGVAISSMTQCVRELVENSIDAGAKCIAVRVDISRYRAQVIDNGMGVARTSLGLIGQRYATSKCHTLTDLDHNLQHLGYRGEALASIISCTGTVEITTRHHLSQQTYTKLFFRSKPMPVTVSSSPRPSIGTTITIHDFFYNLPVRRKALSGVLEMENIRLILQSLALINPSISFSLRNDAVGECILQTRKTNSVLSSFLCLFGANKASGMREVCLEHSPFRITGYVSIESHHNKLLQFLYVNGRMTKKTALHSCANNMIANSLVVRSMPRQANSKWHSHEKLSDMMSPRRTAERHAVYVIMIKCSRSEYNVCLEPAKTLIEFRDWDVILEGLTKVIERFLIQHKLTLGPGCVENEDTENSDSEVPHHNEYASNDEHSDDSSSCFQPKNAISSLNHSGESDGSTDQDIDRISDECGKICSDENRTINGGDTKCGGHTLIPSSLPPQHRRLPPRLHANRPTCSPFQSHGISSKLANLLHKEQNKDQFLLDDTASTSIGSMLHALTSEKNLPSNLNLDIESDNERSQLMSTANQSEMSHNLLISLPPLMRDLMSFQDSFVPQEVLSFNFNQDEQYYDTSVNVRCQSIMDSTRITDCPGIDYVRTNSGVSQNELCGIDIGLPVTSDAVLRSRPFKSHTNDIVVSNEETNSVMSAPRIVNTSTGESNVAGMSNLSKSHASRPDLLSDKSSEACSSSNSFGSDVIWKETFDPRTGEIIFIHSKTGNVRSSKHDGHLPMTTTSTRTNGTASCSGCRSSVSVNNEQSNHYSTSYGSKPLLAAPHLSHDFEGFLPGAKRLRIDPAEGNSEDCTDNATDIWRTKDDRMDMDEGSFENLLKNWKNPAFLPGQEDIASMGAHHRNQIKVHNIINHYKFTKEMLSNIKVLGQVDNKFIACILDTRHNGEHNLLVLFDQHAAHERVRLEILLADLHETSSNSELCPSIKSSLVFPPLLINLTPSEKKLVKLFRKQIELLGVSLKHEDDGSVALASLPSCLMEREVSEIQRGRPAVALELVQNMIIQHLEVLHATAGGSTAIPTALTNVLNSQACHSAIKFGDPLTLKECTDLIQSLSKCKLPFQCAHGRPSLAPILDLDLLKKKYSLQVEPMALCKKLSSKLHNSRLSAREV